MILISLILAATPAPAVKPKAVRPPAAAPRAERRVARSKRLIELEAVVRALPADGAGRGGPLLEPTGL